MAKMLLIGASGSIGEVVAPAVLKNTDKDLVLASRHPRRIPITDASRETAIKLDVTNDDELAEALKDVDFVFASLSGAMDTFASHLVKAMDKAGVKRLAFITPWVFTRKFHHGLANLQIHTLIQFCDHLEKRPTSLKHLTWITPLSDQVG
jgi:hypothetical protein